MYPANVDVSGKVYKESNEPTKDWQQKVAAEVVFGQT